MTLPARRDPSDADELTAELLDRYEEINLLYDIGGTLAGVFDVDVIGRTVVDRAMVVTRASGGLFLMVDGAEARVAYRAGDFPDAAARRLTTGGELLARVLATPLLVQQPLLAVRVQRHGEVFAVIALSGKPDDGVFSAGDGRLMQALAEQAATAIHTERLVRELRRSERLRSELEVARRLQISLLPAAAPDVPGLTLVGTCQPSGQVGGDYFDYFALPNGRLGLVVADVSGHGVSSAIVMAGLRSTLHAEVRGEFSPAHALARANELLARDFASTNMFVSVFLAIYDPATGAIAYSNAGHPPPFLVHGGHVAPLDGAGLIIGVMPDATYEDGRAQLPPGGALVLYTDGITEAHKTGGALFGEPALRALVRERAGGGAEALHAAILAGVREHLGGEGADDDITLVVAARAR
ncbi:MAG: SpoIIE family protein phosphatase [Candidatus Rokubacteria bacterium]|nr:SpoIIE family protein phosphatase [Candidatus Rokubacteria bacterium]